MINQYTIRKATEADAEQILIHIQKVLEAFPDFLASSPEEFNTTLEEEKEWIASHEKHGLLLVAAKLRPGYYVDDIYMSQFV